MAIPWHFSLQWIQQPAFRDRVSSVNFAIGRHYEKLKVKPVPQLGFRVLAQKISFDTRSTVSLKPLCVFYNNG